MIIFLKKIQILTQVSLVVLLGCIALCILQSLARAEEKSSTRDCYRWWSLIRRLLAIIQILSTTQHLGLVLAQYNGFYPILSQFIMHAYNWHSLLPLSQNNSCWVFVLIFYILHILLQCNAMMLNFAYFLSFQRIFCILHILLQWCWTLLIFFLSRGNTDSFLRAWRREKEVSSQFLF